MPGEEDWTEFAWNFNSCDMPLLPGKLLILCKILLLQAH
jgi:hypothetical protein